MRTLRSLCLAGLLGMLATPSPSPSAASAAGRQYYGAWSYNEINRYHYRQYYYKPVPTATTYSYHYVVYYPTRPTYYYYYNPVRKYYWGRFDLEKKGYSLLEEKDRKEKLEDINESAFPKPSEMPAIPDSADKILIEAPPKDAPKDEKK